MTPAHPSTTAQGKRMKKVPYGSTLSYLDVHPTWSVVNTASTYNYPCNWSHRWGYSILNNKIRMVFDSFPGLLRHWSSAVALGCAAKSFKDGATCVDECPAGKYAAGKVGRVDRRRTHWCPEVGIEKKHRFSYDFDGLSSFDIICLIWIYSLLYPPKKQTWWISAGPLTVLTGLQSHFRWYRTLVAGVILPVVILAAHLCGMRQVCQACNELCKTCALGESMELRCSGDILWISQAKHVFF